MKMKPTANPTHMAICMSLCSAGIMAFLMASVEAEEMLFSTAAFIVLLGMFWAYGFKEVRQASINILGAADLLKAAQIKIKVMGTLAHFAADSLEEVESILEETDKDAFNRVARIRRELASKQEDAHESVSRN